MCVYVNMLHLSKELYLEVIEFVYLGFPSGFIIIVIRSLHRSLFKVLMFNFAGGSNCCLFAIAVAFNFIPFYVHMMKL